MAGKGWHPLRSLHRVKVGDREITIVHEVGAEPDHRLTKAQRKERRQDNKEMKLLRKKVRRRRPHGRR